jgi:hypothetical protein
VALRHARLEALLRDRHHAAVRLRGAFAKPTDWVDTSAVCQDEYFRVPLLQYADEVGYWFADLDEIYVKYVSDGATTA